MERRAIFSGMTTPQDPQDHQFPRYPEPMPPEGATSAGPVGTRPAEVDLSFKLWVASCVLAMIGLVYFVVDFDTISAAAREEVRRQFALQGDPVTEAQLESFSNAAFVGGIIFILLASAVQLLLAFLMVTGRNWARIVLAVLSAISVLLGLGSLMSGPGLSLVLNLIGYLVVIGAVVTMFLPAANSWFRSRSRRR